MNKRLFFAMDLEAPWPEKLPERGRPIKPENRHLTLAFLGQTDFSKLKKILRSIPRPDFGLGLVGAFDAVHFFPEKHPHVVAWHVNCFDKQNLLLDYQKNLVKWLQKADFFVDTKKEYLPHVTVCRAHFYPREWKKAFTPIPFYLSGVHLYESLGHSEYRSLWEEHFLSPFEELDHTADIAFKVKGRDLKELFFHAQIALSFSFPSFLSYLSEERVDDLVAGLNELIFQADVEQGCPFKAVSYHGKIEEKEGFLEWEMIVDV